VLALAPARFALDKQSVYGNRVFGEPNKPKESSVTATTNELTAPRRGLVVAVRHSMTRNEFFAGLYILGLANGLLGRAILTANFDGWMGALLGIDINVILLFACYAGVSALLSEKKDEIRSADLVVASIFLGLVILPIFALSWVAVTGLSLYILLFASDGSERRRGAIILLAVTVPMLWSRLLFQFFAKPILDIDATLVAWLLGTERSGNMVQFADSSGSMVVLPACSSLANMSMAFLCWVSVTQWARHKWSPMDLLWSSLACASVIVVNVTRISLMGWSHDHYEAIHSQQGDLVVGSVMLGLMVGFSVIGARRELFSRA
jgi:exosortase/archaeosortase family protein